MKKDADAASQPVQPAVATVKAAVTGELLIRPKVQPYRAWESFAARTPNNTALQKTVVDTELPHDLVD